MEFSWLDFDREDREESKIILRLLEEPGTVDELGFGIIRSYFANKFFPGTTTLQTNAKYFIICPFIFKELEEQEGIETTEKYFEKLAQEERKCAEILIKNCNNDENITGKNTLKHGEWVVRPPSDIYWNGFRKYKIFEPKGGLNKVTFRTYANMVIKGEAKDFWDIDKIYKEDWKKQLHTPNSIELTKEEAEFLRHKITSSQNGTLLAKCLEDENIGGFTLIENFEQFGDFIYSLNISQVIKDEYTIAKDLANFLFCAQIRYNCMLHNKELDEWKEYKKNIKQYAEAINKIPDEKINEIVKNRKELIGFINNLRKVMLSNDSIENKEKKIDALVYEREISNKGEKKSKLNKNYKIQNDEWRGLWKLQYRLEKALDLAKDIKKGLEKC